MRNETWNKLSDIKKVLKCTLEGKWQSGGPIVYYDSKVPYYYDREGHSLYIGKSGVGKSYYGTETYLASLALAKESFIAPDPKGELYKTISPLLSDVYRVIKIDFRNITESDGYNPLIYAYRLYKSGKRKNIQRAKEKLDEIGYGLFPNKNAKDPFWENSARTLFVALAELLFIHATSEEEVNIFNLCQMVMKGDEKIVGSTYLKELVNMEPEDSIARMNLQSYVNAPSDTKGGMRCVFLEGLNPYIRSKEIVNMLSNDDIHMENLDGEKPIAFFIILPDETPIYNTIAGCLLSELTMHFINIAENKYDGKLPTRMNIVIDELASVAPSIHNLPHLMAAARSRNIRITAVLQAFSQLEDVYGKSKADTILSNFGVTIAFSTNNFQTLEELSRRCGERNMKNGKTEPLITPVQLGAMEIGQALIMIENRYKYITNLPNFSDLFEGLVKKNIFVQKQSLRKEIKLFDIKTYVNEKKKEKVQNDINERGLQAPLTFPVGLDAIVPGMQIPDDNGVDIDDILKKIDQKIAELEEEEKAEKAQNVHKEKVYKVRIIAIEEILPVVRFLSDYKNIPIMEARNMIKSLPIEVEFSKHSDAEKLFDAIVSSGGKAILDDWDD